MNVAAPNRGGSRGGAQAAWFALTTPAQAHLAARMEALGEAVYELEKPAKL